MRRDCPEGYSLEAQTIESGSRNSKGKEYAEQDVAAVYDQVREHRAERVLHPDEPPTERHQAEGRGGCPDADVEIFKGKRTDFFGATDEEEDQFLERPLDQQKDDRDDEREPDSPCQVACAVVPVPPAESLGGHSAGAGAQETEVPVQHVEHQRSDRNPADQSRCGSVQMSGHGNVHHPDKRHGKICHNARQSQAQHLSVHRVHSAKVVIKWKYCDAKPEILFKRTNFIVYRLKEYTFVW